MELLFDKYHGTGNDFIMIDNFRLGIDTTIFNQDLVSLLCHRRFGIGADGLIILQPSDKADFEMIYYNADGNPSSMCGNGGRCILYLAHERGYIGQEAHFIASDGLHKGMISDEVSLKLKDVDDIRSGENTYILDTGSPHYVVLRTGVRDMDVVGEAQKIRFSDEYKKEGINVNFVSRDNEGFFLRTYERGVEAETLSCGTGVTASALALALHFDLSHDEIPIDTPGGRLHVRFERSGSVFKNIWLTGPATPVFTGRIKI